MAVNRDCEIEQMYNYLTEEHKQNVHKEAFQDIANVFLDLYDEYTKQYHQYVEFKNNKRIEKPDSAVKWLCNASMGHGKTTVLICFLKWLVSETYLKKKVPILLVIRENGMAEEVFNELKKFDEHCIVSVRAANKEDIEPYVCYHQIVIITHSRLDNLALGYGNAQIYKSWKQYRMNGFSSYDALDTPNYVCTRQRLLIVDEKPSFVNASIFGIDSWDNALDWFNTLSFVLKMQPFQAQVLKTYILHLIANQLVENTSDVTTALMTKTKDDKMKSILNAIQSIKANAESKSKIEAYKKMIHFEKLCKRSRLGRIDDYEQNGLTGRKIIVSERIHYGKLKLNMLVLDGTAKMNSRQYIGFKAKIIQNYNQYARLNMCQDVINTSKNSRLKKGHTTQKAITERILELKQKHLDLFILPTKFDIPIYKKLGAIGTEQQDSFEEKVSDHTRPINLMNTTGKNQLKDKTAMYLTSLPRMNPDYYKIIAISLYGDKVSLKMSEEDDLNWFEDEKLEMVYRGELYAEFLQIVHRTALRKINEDTPIHIYVAFDQNEKNVAAVQPMFWEINSWYMQGKMNYTYHYINDESLYGRGDTIRNFAEDIHHWIWENSTYFNQLPMPVSNIQKGADSIGEKFRKWLSKNNNWINKKEMINKVFAQYGYIIYEQKDRYSSNTKYISTINKHYEYQIFGS
ncbi:MULTISPECIES: hypothetical protein [Paenibacillus]|uniref:hypothetical protein n=1 Tax=Paenibacillus TaxID=44249 RepID=UPI00077C21CF|nr:hypothetical protein [Paenibacillus polymyxa]KYG93996.1 hypothetical protein AZE31_09155 [Paenibacillus polymyxa]